MMYTTVPSMVLALIVFTIAGFVYVSDANIHFSLFTDALAERFHI